MGGHITTYCQSCEKTIEIIMSGDARYCPTCGDELDNDYYPWSGRDE